MTFVPIAGTGFEARNIYQLGLTNVVTGNSGDPFIISTNPRSGNAALQMGGNASYRIPVNEIFSGYFAVGVRSSNTGLGIQIDRDNSRNKHVYLVYNGSTQCYDLYRVSASTKLASGTVPVNPSIWHHIQVRFVLHDSTGILQTKIDGVPDIDYTGNTMGSTSGAFWIDMYQVSNTSCVIDDFIVGTGGWPGDYRCEALTVNSDVSSSLVPSTGSTIYGVLDDIPPSEDYALLRADFRAEIDSGETISTAFQSGALYTANGNEVPDVGMRFLVIGTADFSGGQLATAKGSAVAAGDLFEVTNNTEGTEAVSYVVPRTLHGIASWNKQYKVLKHVALYARARKLEAVDSRMALAIKLADQALSIGDEQTMLTTYTYISRMLVTPPGLPEWQPGMLTDLQIGAEINLD